MSLTVPRVSSKTLRKRDPRRWHDIAAVEVDAARARPGVVAAMEG